MPKNSSEEVDLDEAVEEIAADLFSDDVTSATEGDEELNDDPDTEEVEPEAKEPPATEPPAPQPDTSEAVQEVGAPKTWTKEALEEWTKVPPRVQQEVLKREEDFFRGIEGYKVMAERGQAYESVVEPYRALLTVNQVDPIQLFNSFAANHYMLWKGSPTEKLQLAANLMSSYGIDAVELAQFMQTVQAGGRPVDPELAALREEVNQLRGGYQQQQRQTHDQLVQHAYSEIEVFRADPAHPFFDEVAQDIEQLLKTGAASGLADAYEIAVLRNPDLRAKELARLTPPATPSKPKTSDKKAALAVNVNSTQKPRNGTVTKGSMDETMEDAYDEIMSRDE